MIKHNFPRTESSDKIARDLLRQMHDDGIKGRVPNTPYAAYLISAMVEAVKSVDGDFAEVGVHRGQTAWFIRQCMLLTGQKHKKLYLHDTFEGMKDLEFTRFDNVMHKETFVNTTEDLVKDLFKDDSNVIINRGVFPGTAIGDKFSFVHVDCDLYNSILDCCKYYGDKLIDWGIMLFDDWGSPTCLGATQAIRDWWSTEPKGKLFTPPLGRAYFVAGEH